jgi:hypothetical protein
MNDEARDQGPLSDRRGAMQCSEGLLAAKAYALAEVREAPLRPTVEMDRVQVNDPRQRVTLPGIGRARPSRPSPDPASGRCALPPSPPSSAPDRRTPVSAPKPPSKADIEDATPEPSDAPARPMQPVRGRVTAGIAIALFVAAPALVLVLRLRGGAEPPRPASVAPPSPPNAVLVADPVEATEPAPVTVPSEASRDAPLATEPRAARAAVVPAKTVHTAEPRSTVPASPAPPAAPTQAPNRLFGLQQ